MEAELKKYLPICSLQKKMANPWIFINLNHVNLRLWLIEEAQIKLPNTIEQ